MNTTQVKIPSAFKAMPKNYKGLLTMSPLRPVHDDSELEQATEIIDVMAGHTLTLDQEDYLEALSTLVDDYENRHDSIEPKISGVEALQGLLDDHGMNASDLARLLGVHRSLGSKLLKGERSFTTTYLQILRKHFKVSADLFLEQGHLSSDEVKSKK